MKGFKSYVLSNAAERVLLGFDKYNELLDPVQAMKGLYSRAESIRGMNELKRLQLVYGERPFRLTGKGVELKKDMTKNVPQLPKD